MGEPFSNANRMPANRMPANRMPAEWEPQSATWLSWPHNVETWPANLREAQAEFVALVRAIAASQQVFVMVPVREQQNVSAQLGNASNVRVVELETNDAWARDYAPTFVKDLESGELVAIDWYYNAWGGKYPPFGFDQQVAKHVAGFLEIKHVAGGLCFEGGAIEINDQGVLLTTESCALNPNRNAGLSKADVESILQERLGCRSVVWLPGDVGTAKTLYGDDTDGHVDQIARFANNETILHAWVDESDSRHKALTANVDSLREQLPQANLVPLMLPNPFSHCGREIPASYCNFVVTNKTVIVPQFDVPEDEQAVENLTAAFRGRDVVPLASRNLAVGLGSFHCLTQQQPE